MQFRNNVGDSYSFLIALGNGIFIVKKSAEFQDIVQHILRAVKEKKDPWPPTFTVYKSDSKALATL